MSGLPREVVKWIQSLDLTWQIKTPKWDLTNGYLVAEIFSWYFPQEIPMHSYYNGTSLECKTKNWSLLRNFFKRHILDIPEDYIEGTIHCKEGAAPLLIEKMYEILTNRNVKKPMSAEEVDFTDRAYQNQLPMHARSTASKAVKNNMRITEIMADKSLILSQQKAHHIISSHLEHRQHERKQCPERFEKKPTLGELAIRHPPPSAPPMTEESTMVDDDSPKGEPLEQEQQDQVPEGISRESTVQFKEINVKQLNRHQEQRQGVPAY